MTRVTVASFYRFTDIADPGSLKVALAGDCEDGGLLGTILLANEGINGTLAGSASAISTVLDRISDRLQLAPALTPRMTIASEAPFRRLRVRIRREIVTLGRPDLKPQRRTGKHVSPTDWNRLIADPDTLVIDTRNRYEVEVGTFPGAVNPNTQSFREFPEFLSGLTDSDRRRPVAMFCTGGIRCEKASALMLEAGFDEVHQLDGGVLHYLDSVPADENAWQGECFVFDTRVAIDRDLEEGGYEQCHACRRPLGAQDLASPHYRPGVSCPHCVDDIDSSRRERLEERRRQVELADARGEPHIGPRNRRS